MTTHLPTVNTTPNLISPTIFPNQSRNTPPVKLGIMASGSGSNFEAVAQAIADGQLNAQIQVMIYNNPGIKAVARAEKRGVPVVLHNHRDYKKREELDSQIAQTLRQYGVELVIMAGWMRVVTPVLIDAFPNRLINIHPSLLPSFKGVRAVEQALAAGVKITGCTVHLVCPEVDSGPILIQAAVPVLPDDTSETLHARIQIQEYRIFPQAIAQVAASIAVAGR
ncbi:MULTISPECIES: phosphoribosylglycinamide formyltransferase [unclassified Coleofasciculus]|uniref:phosphoribosylglycinamide formyltransferase n=1 Tax=unclassified Coleofasciculus TaxID=2692782 RepID=UPI00187E3578|nr:MULTISPECIES: phosphoribosylglycinamide formyltransferase [unclassified Coleofasciculus]MBE9129594.1 phosphoribosylglycinamide formyltransferase [Coleofasciculus sp. LEGE 07081]MBE9152147.1 phosphoribosylglycinamide formyltransferase [Coleofasciculus sp. LEGE 07092]